MEMEPFIQLLKEVNIIQIFIIMSGVWYFYRRLDQKIEKINDKLSKKIDDVDDSLSGKIDKLSDKVEDLDRRLCRIEGSLATQGHCLFSQSNQNPDKKAQ